MDERILDALAAGVPVITRGVRLARVIRRAYDDGQRERGVEAWSSAAVIPWTAWISSLWSDYRQIADVPVMLSEWQEWAFWNRVIRESPESADLLQPAATAAAAQQSWALAVEWRLPVERIDRDGGEDSKAFARWANSFRALCRSDGVIDAASIPDLLLESAGRLRLPARVLLAGFDEFSPQQREFLEAVRRAGCESEAIRPPRLAKPGRVVRVPFADAQQSLVAAARWARRIIEDRPGESVGVIVPDLSARRNAVERIFRGILEPAALLPSARPLPVVNLSAGQPLSAYPAVRSALALLQLRPEGNEWEAISALLLDPYVACAGAEQGARASLDARLRKAGLSRLSLADIRGRSGSIPGLRRAISRLIRVWRATPERQSTAAWARTFVAILKAAGWPGEQPLQSGEYQTVETWKAALSEFSATDFAAGEMPLSDASALLARIAENTVFQPEAGDAPVQIMGTLEASGLTFDHLWVAGLDNETWPRAQPRPFSPDPIAA